MSDRQLVDIAASTVEQALLEGQDVPLLIAVYDQGPYFAGKAASFQYTEESADGGTPWECIDPENLVAVGVYTTAMLTEMYLDTDGLPDHMTDPVESLTFIVTTLQADAWTFIRCGENLHITEGLPDGFAAPMLAALSRSTLLQ